MKPARWMMAGVLAVLTSQAVADAEPGVTRLSDPVAIEADAEVFGSRMNDSLPLKRLGELVAAPDDWLGRPVRMQARVSKVCQKKGCFFIAKDGATTLRVSFVDYSFFVPTDIGGRTVELAGELIQVNHSAEEAAHFSADAGASVDPGPDYEIVATSVRVPHP